MLKCAVGKDGRAQDTSTLNIGILRGNSQILDVVRLSTKIPIDYRATLTSWVQGTRGETARSSGKPSPQD